MNTTIDFSEVPVTAVYGSNCFSNSVMAERLPKNIYRELLEVQAGQKELTLEVAEVVASSMRDWALEKGATHFTHWFHPLTGLTAEKHDSFISPGPNGKVIMEFSGKELIKGETDASSFPSGGIRATFEARGYTAWDVTSPAFLKQDPTGTTLCIPTAFFGYYGHALDKKVPLLRSMDAINREALRVLKALGNATTRRVYTTMGAEQEYFLVDKASFDRRPDLMLTGRTVLGSMCAKDQEMEHHYYGAIKEKVLLFMRELNYELWKMGVAAKTQHNEVAPNQFEIAPVFCSSNVAVDGNQLIMETIRKVARRFGMEALLHEKPFAGVNGSGKHNNWSLNTDDGINLLEPGEDPASNARFLLFATAVVEAVDRYALLLRSSAATAGNDYRLGAHEAPPAIISVYFGAGLAQILDNIADGKTGDKGSARGKIQLGVTTLPALPRDVSDRNRTSPFAFTGNKFEFRMIGSSQSVATPNTYLNTAVAQVLAEFAEKLEAAADKNEAIRLIIKDSYGKHRKVVFNGNGYAPEWIAEASRRGLPNVASTPEALPVLVQDDIISLFERHHVLTRDEAESRYHIYLERYSNQVGIEAGIMAEMISRSILPAALRSAGDLARNAQALKAVGALDSVATKRAQAIAKLCVDLERKCAELEAELARCHGIDDGLERAKAFRETIVACMAAVRATCDELEEAMPKTDWPFPSYEDLLFKL